MLTSKSCSVRFNLTSSPTSSLRTTIPEKEEKVLQLWVCKESCVILQDRPDDAESVGLFGSVVLVFGCAEERERART